MIKNRGSSVRCELIPCVDGIAPSVATIWEQLFTANPAAPLTSHPQWLALAAEHGLLGNWFALVITRDNHPIGMLPLRKRSYWSGELLKLFTQDYPQLLLAPDAEEDVWHEVAKWLQTSTGIAMISVGSYSDEQRVERFHAICQEYGLYPFHTPVKPNIDIPLRGSWEQYLAGLGKRTRANVRYAELYLRQDYQNVEVEIITDPSAFQAPLDELIRLYRLRWHNQVDGCAFDHPRNVAFYHHVMAWAMQQGNCALAVLRIGGRIIAGADIFFLPGQHELHCHIVARDMDALPNRYSPGIFLYNHIIRWALDHGFTQLGMGSGNAYYKRLIGGVEMPQWELSVARSPLTARVLHKVEPTLRIVQRLPVHLRYHLSRIGKKAQVEE